MSIGSAIDEVKCLSLNGTLFTHILKIIRNMIEKANMNHRLDIGSFG
jgi:hypothetical protein